MIDYFQGLIQNFLLGEGGGDIVLATEDLQWLIFYFNKGQVKSLIYKGWVIVLCSLPFALYIIKILVGENLGFGKGGGEKSQGSILYMKNCQI